MEPIWISAVVAAVVSAIVAWGKEAVQWLFRRPRLALDAAFHDAEGCRYYYVRVKNHGRTTARQCVSQMTVHPFGLATVIPGGLVTIESLGAGGTASLSDVGMCWQRADKPLEMNIYPGQSQRVELAAVKEFDVAIPSEQGYSQLRLHFEGRGFHCLVRAAADNAKAVERWFEIRCQDRGPVMELGAADGSSSFAVEATPFGALKA